MMEREKRILVPMDGSKCAENILPRVEELATDLNRGICLLRVVSAHTLPGGDAIKAQVKVVREAEEYLHGLEGQLKAKGFDVDTHVRYGNHVNEIVDHADGSDIDLIAMATRGHRGIGRIFLGSVAEKVLRQSSKPMFVSHCN